MAGHHHHHHDHSACIAIPWFNAEQWQKLITVSDDADTLDSSYEKWLAGVKKLEQQLRDQGMHAHRIMLDVEALQKWCVARKRPLNSEARADYASALARRANLG
jgi:hypothetical protein